LQESGRAGRDGAQARAVFLWGPDDERSRERAGTETAKKRLDELLNYARDTEHCRREALLGLLNYEGNNESPETSCCDVCENQADTRLREEMALLDFFRRNKRVFTLNEAVRVLGREEKLRWQEEDAKYAITCLIETGKLKNLKNIFWKNKISLSRSGLPFFTIMQRVKQITLKFSRAFYPGGGSRTDGPSSPPCFSTTSVLPKPPNSGREK
jgi:ATP-dependent DNA helicase RecQ